MTLTIHYGPILDGNIDPEKCFCRPAKKYEEVVEGEPSTLYALPDGRDESEFTVTELDMDEAGSLATRLTTTLERITGEPCMFKVTNDDH